MMVKGGLVLQPDGTAREQDIRIEGGIIAGLESAADLADDTVVDARGRLVAPGLINTHCHSNENFFKGCFDNLPLELWLLFSYPLLASPRQTPREIYVRTMLGCIEMLKSGCTTVVDFLYEFPEMRDETVAAVMQAYLDSGMRVLLVVSAADKKYYETTPIAMELLTPELRAKIDAEP
ncbi:MAG TPA: amidohydrolase family protein, partial [Chloroflexota bacterium]